MSNERHIKGYGGPKDSRKVEFSNHRDPKYTFFMCPFLRQKVDAGFLTKVQFPKDILEPNKCVGSSGLWGRACMLPWPCVCRHARASYRGHLSVGVTRPRVYGQEQVQIRNLQTHEVEYVHLSSRDLPSRDAIKTETKTNWSLGGGHSKFRIFRVLAEKSWGGHCEIVPNESWFPWWSKILD